MMRSVKRLLSVCVLFLAGILCFGMVGMTKQVKADDPAPSVAIEACNLSFKDNVYILYAVSCSDSSLLDDVVLKIWGSDINVAENSAITLNQIRQEELTNKGVTKTYAIFAYTGLSAKQMTDQVQAKAEVEVSGDTYASKPINYSIVQYANTKLADENASGTLKELLVRMVDYGTAAQINFNYHTDRLATDTYYKVKVVNGLTDNGTASKTVKEDGTVTVTANAPATGYVFDKWVDGEDNEVSTDSVYEATVTDDITLTATYKVATYTVTWVSEGSTLETDSNVAYGTTPSYDGATPTKATTNVGNVYTEYTFAGWGTIEAVTGDVTYNATFSEYVYTLVSTADQFTAIYSNLSGYYKLGANLTVSTQANDTAYAFSGVLDGDGHTLTYAGGLFNSLSGTVKNVTLNSTIEGWVAPIASQLAGGRVENVTVNALLKSSVVFARSNDYSPNVAGGMFNFLNGGTISDSTVVVTLNDTMSLTNANAGRDVAITEISALGARYPWAYWDGAGATITNVTAYCINNYDDSQIFLARYVDNTLVTNLPNKAEVNVGGTYQIPVGANFVSSDTSVVTVSDSGLITGIGMGTATISYDINGVQLEIPVTSYTLVSNTEQFMAIYSNLGGYYKMGADITITSCPDPGYTMIYYPGYVFSGILNGGGHTLTITADSMLFTQNTGRIENITMVGTSGSWGGLVAAENNGVITNCTFEITKVNTCGWAYISGDIWSNVGQKGCVVDYNNGTISNCTATITIPSDVQTEIGWVGQSHAVSTLCVYNANQYASSTVTNCTATLINNYNDDSINLVYGGALVEDTAK